jgi:hypothetical protein
MRSFGHSTFIFISTNAEHAPDGVEQRWLAVMSELVQLGSTVHFICVAESPLAEPARSLGVTVAPYILDKWNVIRSRSRLRKYLRRYEPVCAHSTGVEADLLLRWAARRVPAVKIAATLAIDPQRTRRRRPIDALMLRFDEAGLGREDAVFLTRDDLVGEVLASGVSAQKIVLDFTEGLASDSDSSVARHLAVYRGFMAERGHGSSN